ncbi:GNAT family N-acetyltransferase [Metabacillus sp. RGM 3146]|uniref:GNAT family N-acetyltransferase n=1 Tax=Metabacillus sp. RGM 3146 TaxID=3401092 RepID=UPI003B99A67C
MYKIRKATTHDIKQVAKAHVDSWRTTYEGIVDQGYLNALKYEDRERLWEQADHDQLLVAADSSHNIVGFASYGKEKTGEFGYDSELYAIYLLKHVQRQGIGRELFQRMIEDLEQKGVSSIMLWVLEENPSRKFYEAFSPELVAKDNYEISGNIHAELAYGWKNLSHIKEKIKEGGKQ